MISGLKADKDGAGYPIVSWTETRWLLAPGGPGLVRVECRVTKDREGILQFTVRGSTRHGTFERGKPLQALTGFSRHPASQLYYAAADLHALEAVAGKSQVAQRMLKDPGQVILAEFGGEEPIHVNEADASGIELERLEAALALAFANHKTMAAKLRSTPYRWPVGDPRVESFDPERRGWPEDSFATELAGWVVSAGVVGVGILGLIWALRLL